MEIAALIVAALALLLALAARAKAGAAAAELEDLRSDLRRVGANLEEEVEGALGTLRRHLCDVAEGNAPSRGMILEGRLWRDVDAREGRSLVERGDVRVLDVRSPQETAGGVIEGALLIPIDALEARLAELPRDGRATLVYCAGGGRSAAACEFLSAQGFSGLHNLEGGFASWSGPVANPSSD